MNKPALRIAFAGTPVFAANHLKVLINAGYNILGVYTQPDRPSGRGKQDKPSPVKTLALESNLPIFQPQNLKSDDAQKQFEALNFDVLIVVAYGLILPKAILETPRFGCINVHASLLPRWRGAAPIERAMLAGDEQTGITIMQMDAGLDTGDMLLSKATPIKSDDNSESLTTRLTDLGQEALLEVLNQIESETLSPCKQNNELSTYATKLDKEEALIDWNKNAAVIQQQINVFYPRSPAYCFYKAQRLRIIQAVAQTKALPIKAGTISQIDQNGLIVACDNSSLLIKKIQLPGKAEISIKAFLNGRKDYFTAGTILSSSSNQN